MLRNYKSIVFDCDGVILNSNEIKTQAFYKAALPFGESKAQELVKYHLSHGGVSRYLKFNFFLENIIKTGDKKHILTELLKSYENIVWKELLSCEIAPELKKLKEHTRGVKWLVVSGGNQNELRELFTIRKIDYLFEGGIYGSPDDKNLIFQREIHSSNIRLPALYLGDSKYDYHVSKKNHLDFIFVSQWSEIENPVLWIEQEKLNHVKSLGELLIC